jgi:hypothetical protein
LPKTLRENRPFPRVDVYNGATLLDSFFANTSLFPNTYYFNITAGPWGSDYERSFEVPCLAQ